MPPDVELNLTLILFLPWLLILGWLYAAFPRTPKDRARRLFDVTALLLALGAFIASVYWSFLNADPYYGRMWKHILATAVSYGVFLGVLGVAFAVRGYWLSRRSPTRSRHGRQPTSALRTP